MPKLKKFNYVDKSFQVWQLIFMFNWVTDNTMTIYIGNLAYEAENSHLQELVGDTAKVKHINVVRDRQSGRSKGFAFVNLEDEAQDDQVIETLEGQEFMGRNLRVIRAHARTIRIP